MRVVVCGAGAVGGSIGGLLWASGVDTVLVARGEHGLALQREGLRLLRPGSTQTLAVPTVQRVDELNWAEDDLVVMATKVQDAPALLDDLAAVAPAGVSMVCAQNGLAGEPMAARRGFATLGMMVWLPATHLVPGEVRLHSFPSAGILDVGAWPAGDSSVATQFAAMLRAAGFDAQARPDIVAWKRRKLVSNAVGILHALVNGPFDGLARALADEAAAAFSASGADVVSDETFTARVAGLEQLEIDGLRREGGSAWQALVRGRSSEAHYLCCEITLLGALHDVDTPVARAVQKAAARLDRAGCGARALSAAAIWELVGRGTPPTP